MTAEPARTYRSPLRDEQARRTRTRVLDAFVELLADRRADDITTREIAERAGVSQPTVYRHFPDRTALLEGISARIGELMDLPDGIPAVASIDEVGPRIEALLVTSDAFAVEVRAEALLNADPRRYTPETRRLSAEVLDLVAAAFPDLDERRRTHVAGLLRCIGSSQSWLRMREEFGVPGVESGPLLRWAIDTLIAAVRNGELPEIEPAPHPDGGQP
jgi:AcrR family transcriptional regulator